jgi:hypothetical protein
VNRSAFAGGILVTAVLALVALAAPAGAVDFSLAEGANARCFECHSEADVGTIVIEDETRSLTVTPDDTHDSIHVRLDCTACHAGFQAREHTAEETSGWYQQAELDGCKDCHADQFGMYNQSFHGNLVMKEGSTAAPSCADCHGSHGIISPGAPGFRDTILPMCGRCHGEKVDTYLDTYHGKTFRMGETTRAVCTDCHGHHRILPESNPDSWVSDRHVAETCGKCHEHASRKFASFLVHVDVTSPRSSLSVWAMELNHNLLIVGLFLVGGAHCFLYFYRGFREGIYLRDERKH